MSIFTVIMLAIVSYFMIGGFIMGLIDDSYHIMEYVWFWPVHVINWFTELMFDLGYGLREVVDGWRARGND